MDTDVEWTWTILLRGGRLWHCKEAVTLARALLEFYNQGYAETEIEAIIRH